MWLINKNKKNMTQSGVKKPTKLQGAVEEISKMNTQSANGSFGKEESGGEPLLLVKIVKSVTRQQAAGC